MAKDEKGHGSEKRGGKSKINYTAARARTENRDRARPVRGRAERTVAKAAASKREKVLKAEGNKIRREDMKKDPDKFNRLIRMSKDPNPQFDAKGRYIERR